MSYEILINDDHDLIEVRYRGTVPVVERERALAKVSTLVRQTGLRAVLINFSTAQAESEGFESSNRFAAQLARDPNLRGCQIAYLAIDALQVNAVVEALATARQFPLRRFHDRTAAIRWLDGGEPE
ncbi:MAG: hypothetical protein ACREPV_10430 [Lysobacter sp.]